MTFLVQNLLLPSKFYKVYILDQFSQNFVSVRSNMRPFPPFPETISDKTDYSHIEEMNHIFVILFPSLSSHYSCCL